MLEVNKFQWFFLLRLLWVGLNRSIIGRISRSISALPAMQHLMRPRYTAFDRSYSPVGSPWNCTCFFFTQESERWERQCGMVLHTFSFFFDLGQCWDYSCTSAFRKVAHACIICFIHRNCCHLWLKKWGIITSTATAGGARPKVWCCDVWFATGSKWVN